MNERHCKYRILPRMICVRWVAAWQSPTRQVPGRPRLEKPLPAVRTASQSSRGVRACRPVGGVMPPQDTCQDRPLRSQWMTSASNAASSITARMMRQPLGRISRTSSGGSCSGQLAMALSHRKPRHTPAGARRSWRLCTVRARCRRQSRRRFRAQAGIQRVGAPADRGERLLLGADLVLCSNG